MIYVSRLLTDRAMNHLHSLGAPVRIGSEAPPDRAELEAGIAGASAAVITLTERIDADLTRRRRTAAEGHCERRGRVRQHRPVCRRSCGRDRHQHSRRPRPCLRRPHFRADSRRHSPNLRGRPTDSRSAALGVGAADAGRARHQRGRHARHPGLRPHRSGCGPAGARLRHDRHRDVAKPDPGQRRGRCHLRRRRYLVGRQRRRHRSHPTHRRDATT